MADGPVSQNIQRVRLYEEPSRAAYGVDHTGTLGDFIEIPIMEGSVTPHAGHVNVDPGHAVSDVNDWREEVHGPKMWTLSLTVPLAPSGAVAGDTESAPVTPVGRLFKIVMGGQNVGVGTTVNGTWAQPDEGAAAVTTTLKAGAAIAWPDANGILHARSIKEEDGGVLTTRIAFPSAPQDTDVLHPAHTIYVARNPQTFAQFILMGEEDDDRWLFMGGQGQISAINIPLMGDEPPTATFEFQGRRWKYGHECATDLSAEAFGEAVFTNYNAIAAHRGEMIEQVLGNSAIARTPIKEINFSLAFNWQEITAPHAEEGILYMARVRGGEPVLTASFLPTFFEDLTRFGHRDDRDAMYLSYAYGTSALSGLVMIEASTAQYTETTREGADNVAVERINVRGRNDRETVEVTPTEQGRSLCRVHIW